MRRLIYTQFAAVLAYVLLKPTQIVAMQTAAEVAGGTAQSPYQYRVLLPYAFHALSKTVDERVLIWAIWFLLLAILALIIDEFSRSYFADATVILWTLIATTTVAVIIYGHAGAFPYWAGFEVILFATTILLLQRQQYNALLAVVVLATLNRETALFMVLMIALVSRNLRLSTILGAAWAITYGALRIYFGSAEPVFTLHQTILMNLQPVSASFVILLLWFSGSILYAAWKGRDAAPELVQRAAWYIPFYLVAVAVFGVWTEIRLLLPLIPVLAPLAMAGFERESSRRVVSDPALSRLRCISQD